MANNVATVPPDQTSQPIASPNRPAKGLKDEAYLVYPRDMADDQDRIKFTAKEILKSTATSCKLSLIISICRMVLLRFSDHRVSRNKEPMVPLPFFTCSTIICKSPVRRAVFFPLTLKRMTALLTWAAMMVSDKRFHKELLLLNLSEIYFRFSVMALRLSLVTDKVRKALSI